MTLADKIRQLATGDAISNQSLNPMNGLGPR
jgi:hypothetical protein